ncbi:MAG: hypothetical protein RJB11_168, partial [Planctomycetota bacterium]
MSTDAPLESSIRCARRDWLASLGTGLGALAASTLLHRDTLAGAQEASSHQQGLHHPARAKHVIEIFCPGGLSHVDTWDYKPQLEKLDGTPFDSELGKQTFAGVAGKHAKSFWQFRQRGES